MNRGHKQTDLIIMDFARPLTRFYTRGYYTNWNIMGLEDTPTSGSTRGSLGALNKLF